MKRWSDEWAGGGGGGGGGDSRPWGLQAIHVQGPGNIILCCFGYMSNCFLNCRPEGRALQQYTPKECSLATNLNNGRVTSLFCGCSTEMIEASFVGSGSIDHFHGEKHCNWYAGDQLPISTQASDPIPKAGDTAGTCSILHGLQTISGCLCEEGLVDAIFDMHKWPSLCHL